MQQLSPESILDEAFNESDEINKCHSGGAMRSTSVLILGVTLFVTSLQADDQIQFNRDVRPVLAAHCFSCHGFDAGNRKADLRLDLAELATRGRDGSFAIKPFDLKQSKVWQRISSTAIDAI